MLRGGGWHAARPRENRELCIRIPGTCKLPSLRGPADEHQNAFEARTILSDQRRGGMVKS